MQEKGCGDYGPLNRKKAAWSEGANSGEILPSALRGTHTFPGFWESRFGKGKF